MDDSSAAVLAVIVTFFVLIYVSVGLRLFTRIRINQSFGSDDAMIIALLAVFTAYLAAQILGWKHGIGKHESELTAEDRSAALMWWWICFLIYIVCVCLFKIAVGLFLLRVTVDALHIWILRFIMIGVCVCGTGYFFMAVFQCQPPSTWWLESPRTPGKCWDSKIVLGMDLAASIINCGGDWVLGILPIFVVKSLNMRRRTKILVGCLLSFAAVGSTATLIRIFFLPRLLGSDDFLYNSVEVAYLSTVECGIGITAVSLGTLKPLVEQLRGRRGTTTGSNSNGASWSRRNRSDQQRRSYIRAHGTDRTTTPEPRFGSNLNISKDSNQSSSNTLLSFIRGEQDDTAPSTNTNTARTGITKTVEFTQSRNESARTSNLARFSFRVPPAVFMSNRVSLNDPTTASERSLRVRRFPTLPSLFSALNPKRRNSTPQSPNSATLALFNRQRTNKDENGGAQVELSPV